MTKIENLLSKPGIFRVDPTACMVHAERIRNFQTIAHSGKWSLAPKSIQLAFKTVFIISLFILERLCGPAADTERCARGGHSL